MQRKATIVLFLFALVLFTGFVRGDYIETVDICLEDPTFPACLEDWGVPCTVISGGPDADFCTDTGGGNYPGDVFVNVTGDPMTGDLNSSATISSKQAIRVYSGTGHVNTSAGGDLAWTGAAYGQLGAGNITEQNLINTSYSGDTYIYDANVSDLNVNGSVYANHSTWAGNISGGYTLQDAYSSDASDFRVIDLGRGYEPFGDGSAGLTIVANPPVEGAQSHIRFQLGNPQGSDYGYFEVRDTNEDTMFWMDGTGDKVYSVGWEPLGDGVDDLGAPDHRWGDLYLAGTILGTGSGESIYLNATTGDVRFGFSQFNITENGTQIRIGGNTTFTTDRVNMSNDLHIGGHLLVGKDIESYNTIIGNTIVSTAALDVQVLMYNSIGANILLNDNLNIYSGAGYVNVTATTGKLEWSGVVAGDVGWGNLTNVPMEATANYTNNTIYFAGHLPAHWLLASTYAADYSGGDIDDADIEGDLNTYVDIAGDLMVGDLAVYSGSGYVNITAASGYINTSRGVHIGERIGVGTGTPATMLEITGAHLSGVGLLYLDARANTHAFMSLDAATDNNAGFLLRENGVTKWALQNDGDDSDKLELSDDGDIRMTWAQTGVVTIHQGLNVGTYAIEADSGDVNISDQLIARSLEIGTRGAGAAINTIYQKWDVDNSAQSPYAATKFLVLSNNDVTAGHHIPIQFYVSQGESAIIDASLDTNDQVSLRFWFRGGGAGDGTEAMSLTKAASGATSALMHGDLKVYKGAGYVNISAAGGDIRVSDDLFVVGGINVGSEAGAGAGDVKLSGSLTVGGGSALNSVTLGAGDNLWVTDGYLCVEQAGGADCAGTTDGFCYCDDYIEHTHFWDVNAYGSALEEILRHEGEVIDGISLVNYDTFSEPVRPANHSTGISIGGRAAQNEYAIVELLEKIDFLKSELCKKDSTYSWCREVTL